MAPKNTLNAQNLEALGAKRLAELLIEISSGDAAAKRRLRLALAGAQSPTDAAHEIRKRPAAISRSRRFVDWQNRRALVEDLQTQRHAINEHVGKADPKEALDLALASSVFARCDDNSGTVIGIFHEGVSDLGERLADRACEALAGNEYGESDGLVATLSPALGEAGLQHLKSRFVALSRKPTKKLPEHERRKIGWAMSGAIYEDEIADRHRARVIEMALRDIADAQGDVDAFIAQYGARNTKGPAHRRRNRRATPCGPARGGSAECARSDGTQARRLARI